MASRVDYEFLWSTAASPSLPNLNFSGAAGGYAVVELTTGDAISGVTVGGQALALILSRDDAMGGATHMRVYAGPVTGSGDKTVVVSGAADGQIKRINASSFEGVDSVRGQSSAITSSPSAPSLNIATVAGDLVLMCGDDNDVGKTFAATAGTAFGIWINAVRVATGTPTTIAGTLDGGTGVWQAAIVALVPLAPPATVGGTATLGDVGAGGGMLTGGSQLGGTATLDDAGAGGGLAPAPGYLRIPALSSWAEDVPLTSVTIPKVAVVRMSDITMVCAFLDQTTHATTGDLLLAHTALMPGTACMVLGFDASGANSFRRQATVTATP